jgi:hypothetical protein
MTTIWTNKFKHPIDYLCQETGITDTDLLLFEDDSQIVLEQTGTQGVDWTERTKN